MAKRKFKTPEQKRLSLSESRDRTQYQFPADLGTHAFLMWFEKYNYKRVKASGDVEVASERVPQDSFLLPLPMQLSEQIGLKVASNELGLTGDLAARVGSSTMNASGFGDAINRIIAEFGTAESGVAIAQGLGKRMIKGVLSALDPDIVKGFEIGTGALTNPYQALEFNGVELRTHQFSWTFAPTTRAETETLKQILARLKYHVHPQYLNAAGVTARSFLAYPDIINCKILGSPVDGMPTYKPGMIQSLNVNFVGGNELAFLEGGDPAVVEVQMSMMEATIWTREDYQKNTADNVKAPQTATSTVGGGLEI